MGLQIIRCTYMPLIPKADTDLHKFIRQSLLLPRFLLAAFGVFSPSFSFASAGFFFSLRCRCRLPTIKKTSLADVTSGRTTWLLDQEIRIYLYDRQSSKKACRMWPGRMIHLFRKSERKKTRLERISLAIGNQSSSYPDHYPLVG